jgi:drug/metabolite transporter (DMT)-like permease
MTRLSKVLLPGQHQRFYSREIALLFVLATIWSSSFMFIKVAVQTITPVTLSFGRLALAAIVLTIYSFARGDALPRDRRTWIAACVIALIGNALPFSLIHWGERFVDSSLTAILMGVMPLAVALMAHFATESDPLTGRRAMGIAIGFFGLVVLIGREALDGLDTAALAQVAIIAAALSYAVTTIFVRRVTHLTGRPMAMATLICGAAILLPLAFAFEQPLSLSPDSGALGSLLMLGIFSTGIATLMYFRLVHTLGATTFSQINYLIPILGVGWGALVLDEQPGMQEAIALGLILTGIALVNQPGKRA